MPGYFRPLAKLSSDLPKRLSRVEATDATENQTERLLAEGPLFKHDVGAGRDAHDVAWSTGMNWRAAS
jgi:hypothetical protein